jgi:hypothetical protein
MKKSPIEHVVSNLPETVEVDALIERLQLPEKIKHGEKQFARGAEVPYFGAIISPRESLKSRVSVD